jgi:NAD(P)H dehydrogenase (quinone)
MNGDKFSTIQYFVTLAMQHGRVWVRTGLPPANTKSATRNDVDHLGGFAGLLAQSPVDALPDRRPAAGRRRRTGRGLFRRAVTVCRMTS